MWEKSALATEDKNNMTSPHLPLIYAHLIQQTTHFWRLSWISQKDLQGYSELIMKIEYIEKVSDMGFQALL